MNAEHLKRCSSAEWAETVQQWIIPWVLEGVELGDDVLELGPGPGLTTDVLRTLVPRLTAVEVDPDLARSLDARLAGMNVEVVCADATRTQLPGERFSGVVCLTMLHHVDSVAAQDELFAEVHRLLRPGGILAGQDTSTAPTCAPCTRTTSTFLSIPRDWPRALKLPASARSMSRPTSTRFASRPPNPPHVAAKPSGDRGGANE